MRARRSAKFAEYLSTYAILEHIGIHPTTLIEKRDAGVGMGVYVRDACDAGTALLAVPSKRFCTNSVLSRVGLKTAFRDPWTAQAAGASVAPADPSVQEGLLAFLVGSPQWAELAWRLALEQHRSVSPLWGWLQSLPSMEAFTDQRDSAERHCRVHYPMLLPYYRKARQRIDAETAAAYAALRPDNLLPCFDRFTWAVEVLLSRSRLLPTAWPATQCASRGPSSSHDEVTGEDGDDGAALLNDGLECGVVPFLDLVNGPDNIGRVVNADIEVATSLNTLPRFLRDELVADAVARGRGDAALAELERLLEAHYFLCLTLRQPLRATEEVVLDWPLPVLTTGVLDASDDAVLSRLLKYMY